MLALCLPEVWFQATNRRNTTSPGQSRSVTPAFKKEHSLDYRILRFGFYRSLNPCSDLFRIGGLFIPALHAMVAAVYEATGIFSPFEYVG
jgi:hypothetical protein